MFFRGVSHVFFQYSIYLYGLREKTSPHIENYRQFHSLACTNQIRMPVLASSIEYPGDHSQQQGRVLASFSLEEDRGGGGWGVERDKQNINHEGKKSWRLRAKKEKFKVAISMISATLRWLLSIIPHYSVLGLLAWSRSVINFHAGPTSYASPMSRNTFPAFSFSASVLLLCRSGWYKSAAFL